jgi:hypothetical protein
MKTGKGIGRLWLTSLLSALLLSGNAVLAQDPVTADWLALATRSSAVVIGVLMGPQQTVERTDVRTPELVRLPDGAYQVRTSATQDYVAGRMWRVRVDEVVSGDGRATVGGVVQVFHEGQLLDAQAGQRFLLFLHAPIVLGRGADVVSGWRSLYGTVLTNEESDDEAAFDPSNAYSIVFPTQSSSAQGTLAVAADNAGQVEAIKSAIHAQGLPSAAVVTPSAGALLRGTVALSATATDDVGVLGVQFRLDGRDLGDEVTPKGLGAVGMAWDTSTVADGAHEMIAVARDAAGNRTSSVPVVLATDNTPPVLELHVQPAALWPADERLVTVNVAVTVSDAQDSDPRVYLVSIGCDERSRGTVGIPENGKCANALNIVGAQPGTDDREFQLRAGKTSTRSVRTYTITYAARDAAGNQTTASVTIQVLPPAVPAASPSLKDR